MEDFKTVLEFKNYIKQNCSISVRETLLDKEANKEISVFLSKNGIDRSLCDRIQENYDKREDSVNMYYILQAVGFNKREIKNLMDKMKLPKPTFETVKEEVPSNTFTINYDEAWRQKIFARYFKGSEGDADLSIDKIIELAGKVYADKAALDVIVNYYAPTEKYMNDSVWGIAEEIITKYKNLSSLKYVNTKMLAGKIGKAIVEYK